jgi:hypothetical protein
MDYRDKNFDEYENYYELEIDNFDELHKELSRPTIINNQRIHNAINPNNTVRWSVALVCAGHGWNPMLAKDYFYKSSV